MPMWIGFLLVAVTAAFAGASYAAGSRDTRLRVERRRRRRGVEEHDPVDRPRERALPPTIVAPGGEPPPPPPPPRPRPPLVPPTIATPDRALDPTRVEDLP